MYADNFKFVSGDFGLLLRAVQFTSGHVRLVGQEVAPSEVRKDMKDWVLSQDGGKWSVKIDVRDLGGYLDTTFRGWSSTLAARVRLVISRLVLIFSLALDFYGRVRVVWSGLCVFLLLCMGLKLRCLLRIVSVSFGPLSFG